MFKFWKLYVLELLCCVQLGFVTLRDVTFTLCCFTLCSNIIFLQDDMHRYFVDCTVYSTATIQTYKHKDRQECVLILVTLAFPSNVCSISTHSRNFFVWESRIFPHGQRENFSQSGKSQHGMSTTFYVLLHKLPLIIKHNNRHILLQHIPAFYIYLSLSVSLFIFSTIRCYFVTLSLILLFFLLLP